MKIQSHIQNIIILCCIFLLLIASSCNSQNQAGQENKIVQPKSEGKWLKYTTGVRSFLEDSNGNIWFGSDREGVCLLRDGQFKYFTIADGLSHNQVRNIYEDKNGVIWFECGKGLSIYDGQQMSVYQERNYDSSSQWKLGDNDIWFKSDEIEGHSNLEQGSGVYQYDGKKLYWRRFPVTPSPEDVHKFQYAISTPFVKGKDGTIWFGAYKALIGYNGSDFKILNDEYFGLTKEERGLHIRGFLEDKKGNIWMANNGSGVWVYDGKQAINFTAKHKLRKEDTNGNSLDRAYSIGEDAAGNIWISTVESGVWRYDGKSVTNFTEKDGLSKFISTIYKTKQGELWFGGNGVYRFNGQSFERIY